MRKFEEKCIFRKDKKSKQNIDQIAGSLIMDLVKLLIIFAKNVVDQI